MTSSGVRAPSDLRALSEPELEQLAHELRQRIVSTALRNGGHLGASLGTVELSISLHRIFHSPAEPIIWDVGHQAYAHKLLTGRAESFGTLRIKGGISGFPTRAESEHDVFGTGHSSTALSAALAAAWARRGTDQWTVAVVGDGSLSAGIAFEALNNVKSQELGPLLVILNDNHMSISKSVGALTEIFSGAGAREFFERFGFEYHGPFDGHHVGILSGALDSIRKSRPQVPILLHVLTEKGRGYAPAEQDPGSFHGVSPVKSSPEKLPSSKETRVRSKSFSEEFGKQLVRVAAQDDRVVAITAAMAEGTGLAEFARRFGDRFFDVGIAEPHAVTFAAGLATQGYRPVVAIYSTFLQRALDSIIHDVALQNLPVTFAVDRAGLVGPDGPTHHGAFDISYLGLVPGMTIYAPACLEDLGELLEQALSLSGAAAVRFPRGGSPSELLPLKGAHMRRIHEPKEPGKIVVALGHAIHEAGQAVRQVDPDAREIALLNVVQAKPVPDELLVFLKNHPRVPVLCVEGGAIQGGFGHALSAALGPEERRWYFAGIEDRFISHGTIAEQEEDTGISSARLAQRLRDIGDAG